MKIAFVSYEYPPDAAYGGIATYTQQAARMLSAAGHTVEVFTSSPARAVVVEEAGVLVHRIREAVHARFPEKIAGVFAERHAAVAFDVVESPEYGADASAVARLVPDVPLVVKLHTPSFLLTKATYDGLGARDPLFWRLMAGRIRAYASMLMAGAGPVWRYAHKYALDSERRLTLDADLIASPSQALAAIAAEAWRFDLSGVAHVPYPYVPSEALLALPPGGSGRVVTFLGRLEVRKGVLDLARAIPPVLRRHPDTVFRFVGPDDESPSRDMGMRDYLAERLRPHGPSVQFSPPIPNSELPGLFAESSMVVIPSIWENFANVCLESMAAGRAVIASQAGGMAEMIRPDDAGLLVPPHDPRSLARAIISLLDAPQRREELGRRARCAVLRRYAQDRICRLQEESYQLAIDRHRQTGGRAH